MTHPHCGTWRRQSPQGSKHVFRPVLQIFEDLEADPLIESLSLKSPKAELYRDNLESVSDDSVAHGPVYTSPQRFSVKFFLLA